MFASATFSGTPFLKDILAPALVLDLTFSVSYSSETLAI